MLKVCPSQGYNCESLLSLMYGVATLMRLILCSFIKMIFKTNIRKITTNLIYVEYLETIIHRPMRGVFTKGRHSCVEPVGSITRCSTYRRRRRVNTIILIPSKRDEIKEKSDHSFCEYQPAVINFPRLVSNY